MERYYISQVFLLVFVVACSSTNLLTDVVAVNRSNLLKLSPDMTKSQVIKIMGDSTIKAKVKTGTSELLTQNLYTGKYMTVSTDDYNNVTVTNPYRSEIIPRGESPLEVIYYLTDIKKDDSSITDDELTPLVFEKGILKGWGWSYLESENRKIEVRVR